MEQHSLFEPHATPSAFFVHGGFASVPESIGVEASVPPPLDVLVPLLPDELVVDPLDEEEEEEEVDGSGDDFVGLSSSRLF